MQLMKPFYLLVLLPSLACAAKHMQAGDAAGGDLAGTYPNPKLAGGNTSYAQINPTSQQSGEINVASGTVVTLFGSTITLTNPTGSQNLVGRISGLPINSGFGPQVQNTQLGVYSPGDGGIPGSFILFVSTLNSFPSASDPSFTHIQMAAPNAGDDGQINFYAGNSISAFSMAGSTTQFNGAATFPSILKSLLATDSTGVVVSTNIYKSTNVYTAQQSWTSLSPSTFTIVAVSSSTFIGATFSSLGSTAANGNFKYCSDCTVVTPASCTANALASCVCAASGTGAFAKRLNGAWYCN